MLLGCIGDDFTGSSDLANTLARGGMRCVQYTGIPDGPAAPEVQAGVVALKTRSVPAAEAVATALEALAWLRAQGCRQIFFKYCSTFDSTPQGNIGPVAEALAGALDARRVVFCPAFPGTGRSVYQGHLFVKDALLSESGMQNHPLTPMTDPDLRRVLARQTTQPVGHVAAGDVFAGPAAIAAALAREDAAGRRFVVVDALRDEDLTAIGAALKDAPLVTGGSGVALGLPANFGCAPGAAPWTPQAGPAIALCGSCSDASRRQVARHAAAHPALEVTAQDAVEGARSPEDIARALLAEGAARGGTPGASSGAVPLVYSSSDPEAVAAAQARYGRARTSAALEGFFARIAVAAVAAGATRVITAGGETSSAIVEALGVPAQEIGPEIDPGVPALRARGDLVMALKSGNFGGEDFFAKAASVLAGAA